MKQKLYTSLYLSEALRNKFHQCADKLGIDKCELLSVLCYKAGVHVCKQVKSMELVDYQERGGDYVISPVYFWAADHEYMHANRLACKVSVSKLLSCAMELFLDEIMEKGINQIELAHLQVIENSYKQKSNFIRNCMFTVAKNDYFEEYIMRMRIKKHKPR